MQPEKQQSPDSRRSEADAGAAVCTVGRGGLPSSPCSPLSRCPELGLGDADAGLRASGDNILVDGAAPPPLLTLSSNDRSITGDNTSSAGRPDRRRMLRCFTSRGDTRNAASSMPRTNSKSSSLLYRNRFTIISRSMDDDMDTGLNGKTGDDAPLPGAMANAGNDGRREAGVANPSKSGGGVYCSKCDSVTRNCRHALRTVCRHARASSTVGPVAADADAGSHTQITTS